MGWPEGSCDERTHGEPAPAADRLLSPDPTATQDSHRGSGLPQRQVRREVTGREHEIPALKLPYFTILYYALLFAFAEWSATVKGGRQI